MDDEQVKVSALDAYLADLPARITAETAGELHRDEFRDWLLRHRSHPDV